MRTILIDTNIVSILFPPQHALYQKCLEEIGGIWADVIAESRRKGRPMKAPDAWIAATAKQWELPLMTADFRDFNHLDALTLIPI